MIGLSMANVLAGDVGGTTTRLGVFEPTASRPRLLSTRAYGTTESGGIAGIVGRFLREAAVDARSIGAACFGAAGPVRDGVARLTNSPVVVDASAIGKANGIGRVSLLNDLEALAYAVPALSTDELHVLQEGRADPAGAIAVIAAGTGLGEAV